jgi:hypothetical protein
MSALFDFQSFLTVVLLFICSCTYYKLINPGGLTQTTGCVAFGVGWVRAAAGGVQTATLTHTLASCAAARNTHTTGSRACSGRQRG